MTGPQVVLRADASVRVGTGHVVRCRTLAAALIARGWTATLVTRDLPAGLRRSVLDAGLAIVDVPREVEPDNEPAMLAGAPAGAPTLLIVDSYAIGPGWLVDARRWAPAIMAIDDLADRPLPVDLLLNQNLGADADRYRTLVPADARLLIGPAYALLRPEFSRLRSRRRARSGRLERVLVFMSGADADDVTRRAAEGVDAAGLAADVVVGAAYPNLNRLRDWTSGRPRVQLHVDTSEMAELMAGADLAIGAPGSASWERCAVGLPTILLVLADNQLEAGRLLVEAGAACSLGWHTGVSVDDVTKVIVSLRDDPVRLRAMGKVAAGITDGDGTARVVAAVEQLLRVHR